MVLQFAHRKRKFVVIDNFACVIYQYFVFYIHWKISTLKRNIEEGGSEKGNEFAFKNSVFWRELIKPNSYKIYNQAHPYGEGDPPSNANNFMSNKNYSIIGFGHF